MHLDSIQKSYEQAGLLYDLFWAKRKSASLHFGYWDDGTKNLQDALKLHKQQLADFAEMSRNAKVLDMGCGVGGAAIFLANNFNSQVTGVNISSSQLKEAENNVQKAGLQNQILFLEVDYLNTKLPSENFDVLWAVESFFHCEDKIAFLKEAYRLLKPDGKLILADYFLTGLSKSKQDMQVLATWFEGFHIPNLLNIENLEVETKKVGFCSYEYKDISRAVMPSSKRLCQLGRLGTLSGQLIKWLPNSILDKLPFNLAHTKATVAQYKALKKGLWQYGFCWMGK